MVQEDHEEREESQDIQFRMVEARREGTRARDFLNFRTGCCYRGQYLILSYSTAETRDSCLRGALWRRFAQLGQRLRNPLNCPVDLLASDHQRRRYPNHDVMRFLAEHA